MSSPAHATARGRVSTTQSSLVPTVERRPWGFICLFLNLWPGVGTMVAGGNQKDLRSWAFGFVQFIIVILAALLVGVSAMAGAILTAVDVVVSVAMGVLILLRSK